MRKNTGEPQAGFTRTQSVQAQALERLRLHQLCHCCATALCHCAVPPRWATALGPHHGSFVRIVDTGGSRTSSTLNSPAGRWASRTLWSAGAPSWAASVRPMRLLPAVALLVLSVRDRAAAKKGHTVRTVSQGLLVLQL